MKLGFLVVLLIPLLAQAYISWRVWQLLPLPTWVRVCIVALMLLALASMFISFAVATKWPLDATAALYAIGTTWIEILLYLTLTFVVLDVLRLCHIVPPALLHGNMLTAGVIAALMTGLFVYGNITYRNKVRNPLTLRSAKISRPIKAVMVSDLHLGFHNRRNEFSRWVDLINAENPDVVLIAGDIIDFSAYPLVRENVAEEFRRLKAPVYACFGNHEYISGDSLAQRFFADAGITLLRDSVATVGDVCIIGRDDRSNPRRKALAEVITNADRSKYLLVLDHQPTQLEEPDSLGIDFQFSGHTHYGQIWPGNWVTKAIFEVPFGPYKKSHTEFYVSSGLGIWGGKYRIGTRSEYIVATFENGK